MTENELADVRSRLEHAHRQLDSLRSRHKDAQDKLQAAGRSNERLTGMLEATRNQIAELRGALEADGQAPFTFGTIIGYRPSRDRVEGREIEAASGVSCDILHGGRKMRVSVSPSSSPQSCTPDRRCC